MYYELFALLHECIYGADVVLDQYQTLVLTNAATIGSLLMIAIPFLVVWRIIRIFW